MFNFCNSQELSDFLQNHLICKQLEIIATSGPSLAPKTNIFNLSHDHDYQILDFQNLFLTEYIKIYNNPYTIGDPLIPEYTKKPLKHFKDPSNNFYWNKDVSSYRFKVNTQQPCFYYSPFTNSIDNLISFQVECEIKKINFYQIKFEFSFYGYSSSPTVFSMDFFTINQFEDFYNYFRLYSPMSFFGYSYIDIRFIK